MWRSIHLPYYFYLLNERLYPVTEFGVVLDDDLLIGYDGVVCCLCAGVGLVLLVLSGFLKNFSEGEKRKKISELQKSPAT